MAARIVRIYVLWWAHRLAWYAIWEMQTYLTKVWKLSLTHAAGIVNVWGGIIYLLPLGLIFIVDAFMGHYIMLVLSSVSYTAGLILLWMSTPPILAGVTNTCTKYEPKCVGHTQKVLFYIAMAIVAVGISSQQVSLIPFAEKNRENEAGNGLRILSRIFTSIVVVTGSIGFQYIKPWSIIFGIPAICTFLGTLVFISGSPAYIKSRENDSRLINTFRVFVASASNMSTPFPSHDNEHYKHSPSRTRTLRCLEKAAITLPNKPLNEQETNIWWQPCTIREVEDAKIVVRMVPMWMTFIICGTVSSINNSFFVGQLNNLDPSLGKWKVPPQIFLMLFDFTKFLLSEACNLIKGKAPAFCIPIAMIFSILCCITAAKVETRRLNVIRSHGLLDKPNDEIPMSMFWLVFQFILLACLDAFFEEGLPSFFEKAGPGSLTEYIKLAANGVRGLGYMGSVLTVFVVGKISEKGGKQSWFQFTLNESRLDRYYWVLAALSSINLLVYVCIAFRYYKIPRQPRDKDELENIRLDRD